MDDTSGTTIYWDYDENYDPDTYLVPPYNNCGAKYDVLSGNGGGCNDEMTDGDSDLFNNAWDIYDETIEREYSIYTEADYPNYDTF